MKKKNDVVSYAKVDELHLSKYLTPELLIVFSATSATKFVERIDYHIFSYFLS